MSGPVGVIVGSALTLTLMQLPRLFRRGEKKSQKPVLTPIIIEDKKEEDVPSQQSPDVAAVTKDQEAVKTRIEQQAALKAAKALKQAEEENAKLRSFMAEHMRASEKFAHLEEELHNLKTMKDKLQQELEEEKKARENLFSINSGEELSRFKSALAQQGVPFLVRSVCSEDRADSIDGGTAATVAAFAMRNTNNTSFLRELVTLVGLAAPPPRPPSRKGDAPTPKGSQAGSVASVPISIKAAPPAASNKQMDVSQIFDQTWGGGRF